MSGLGRRVVIHFFRLNDFVLLVEGRKILLTYT